MEQIIDNKIIISAPGKTILFGEHSVVYGRTALAFSLDLRTRVKISSSKGLVRIILSSLSIDYQWAFTEIEECWYKIADKENKIANPKELTVWQQAEIKKYLLPPGYNENQNNSLVAIFHQYMSILPYPVPLCLTLSSKLPSGGGLGSSAAFSVCISAAFIYLTKKAEDPSSTLNDCKELICDWSLISEKLFHGKPSGIDNAISTYGGAISFTKGVISQLNMPVLQILLVNTGVTRNTKVLVDKVRQHHELIPNVYESVFTVMEDIVKSALSELRLMKQSNMDENKLQEKYLGLNNLVRVNQGLLSAIGVSHPRIDEVVDIAKNFGFYAKLTGAGGGGFVFTILNNYNIAFVNNCQIALRDKGFVSWVTDLNGKGVTLQQ